MLTLAISRVSKVVLVFSVSQTSISRSTEMFYNTDFHITETGELGSFYISLISLDCDEID